jgi:hypothetical protein
LVMRHPDVPNHPDQAYTLSPTGVAIAEAIREQLDDEATAE